MMRNDRKLPETCHHVSSRVIGTNDEKTCHTCHTPHRFPKRVIAYDTYDTYDTFSPRTPTYAHKGL